MKSLDQRVELYSYTHRSFISMRVSKRSMFLQFKGNEWLEVTQEI